MQKRGVMIITFYIILAFALPIFLVSPITPKH